MTANKYNLFVAIHQCDSGVYGKHHEVCDKTGCSQAIQKTGENKFGPGDGYIIDSSKQFTVKVEFHKNVDIYDRIDRVEVTLTQGSVVELIIIQDDTCALGYLDSMKEVFRYGMASSIKTKAVETQGLDKGFCTGSCDTSYSTVISNISYVTKPDIPAPPAPTWTCGATGGCTLGNGAHSSEQICLKACGVNYTFGRECDGDHFDYCGTYCPKGKCQLSYTTLDPKTWTSDSVACRCNYDEDVNDFEYGVQCNSESDCQGECATPYSCKWSWLKTDPAGYDSPGGACRCQPE